MTTNTPKISIVTPSYNQGEYIEETILSVINQNYPNLEYIIMDGGSTDQTIDIIKKYEDKIAYWVSKPDDGQSDAIRSGFQKSTGEIITWLNSDDILETNALLKMAQAFQDHPEKSFIYGLNTDFEESGQNELRSFPLDKLHLRAVYSFPYSQPACFYRREVLDKIGYPDVSFHFAMDHDFFVRIVMNFSCLHIKEKISRQRIHEGTKTSNLINVCREDTRKIVRNFLYSLPETTAKIESEKVLNKLLPTEVKYKSYPIAKDYSEEEIYIVTYEHLVWYVGQWYNKRHFGKVKIFFHFFEKKLGKAYIKSSSLSTIYFRFKFLPHRILKLRTNNK